MSKARRQFDALLSALGVVAVGKSVPAIPVRPVAAAAAAAAAVPVAAPPAAAAGAGAAATVAAVPAAASSAAAAGAADPAAGAPLAPAPDPAAALAVVKADYTRRLADLQPKVGRLLDLKKKNPALAARIDDLKTEIVAMAMFKERTFGLGGEFIKAQVAQMEVLNRKCFDLEMEASLVGKDPRAQKDLLIANFQKRFGVELISRREGDSPAQVVEALRRVYELMTKVPPSHAVGSAHLKQIARVGGTPAPEDKTGYHAEDKAIHLRCGRPDNPTSVLSGEDALPLAGRDPDCLPKEGVVPKYFDWATLHEIGHAVEASKNYMGTHPNGWSEHAAADLALILANHFLKNSDAATVDYVKALIAGSAPAAKPPLPAARAAEADAKLSQVLASEAQAQAEAERTAAEAAAAGAPDAAKKATKAVDARTRSTLADVTRRMTIRWENEFSPVESWIGEARSAKKPWFADEVHIGGRIYHEGNPGKWVSYPSTMLSKGITKYQFKAPKEWFAELYAAYQCGVLQKSHPAVAWLESL